MSNQAVVGKLAKPVLRGHVQSHIRKHLAIATVLSIAGALGWKYLIAEPRKTRYAEFYKNYDIQKEEKRLKDLGLYDNPFPFDDE